MLDIREIQHLLVGVNCHRLNVSQAVIQETASHVLDRDVFLVKEARVSVADLISDTEQQQRLVECVSCRERGGLEEINFNRKYTIFHEATKKRINIERKKIIIMINLWNY